MSTEALNVALRIKSVAKKLKDANDLVSDILSAYVDTGVDVEVAAVVNPGDLVPGTSITKQQYLDIISTLEEFESFYRNAAVTTQDNEAFVNRIFKGG